MQRRLMDVEEELRVKASECKGKLNKDEKKCTGNVEWNT